MPDATLLAHPLSNILLRIYTTMSKDLPGPIAFFAGGKSPLAPAAFRLLDKSIWVVKNVIMHFVGHVFLSCIARSEKSPLSSSTASMFLDITCVGTRPKSVSAGHFNPD